MGQVILNTSHCRKVWIRSWREGGRIDCAPGIYPTKSDYPREGGADILEGDLQRFNHLWVEVKWFRDPSARYEEGCGDPDGLLKIPLSQAKVPPLYKFSV